jgi:hypothetical protein
MMLSVHFFWVAESHNGVEISPAQFILAPIYLGMEVALLHAGHGLDKLRGGLPDEPGEEQVHGRGHQEKGDRRGSNQEIAVEADAPAGRLHREGYMENAQDSFLISMTGETGGLILEGVKGAEKGFSPDLLLKNSGFLCADFLPGKQPGHGRSRRTAAESIFPRRLSGMTVEAALPTRVTRSRQWFRRWKWRGAAFLVCTLTT